MKILLTALTLAVVPSLALAWDDCYYGKEQTTAQMSCAEGTVYDADAGNCVPAATS